MVSMDTEALRTVWSRWADILEDLSEDDWERQTRCDGWNVRALAAHVGDGVLGLHAVLSERATQGSAEVHSAATLMARLKPDADSARHLARKADRRAQDSSTRAFTDLMAPFATPAEEVVRRLEVAQEAVFDYFGRASVSAEALVELALLEGVVHLLDLASALESTPGISDDVLGRVSAILLTMTRPEAFIELATGRRAPAEVLPFHA